MLETMSVLSWPILERIRIGESFALSPHGIAIALGVLAGAQLATRRAERRGVARHPVDESPAQVVQSLLLRAVIGGIIGARFFYVATRLDAYPDPAEWLRVWEGGLSLLGGMAGAVLANIPFVVRRDYRLSLLLDSVAPGLALGLVIGRVGDLVIGEHLGGRTDFVLGWRCAGAVGDPAAPYPWPGPTAQGCFDTAVHQTALYDLLAAAVVLGALLLAERRPRFDGFFAAMFVVLYGVGRFVTDFAREADLDLLGPLTGSQVTAVVAILATLAWILVARPWRRRPYTWAPPAFEHPWDERAAVERRAEPGEERVGAGER